MILIKKKFVFETVLSLMVFNNLVCKADNAFGKKKTLVINKKKLV